MTKQRYWLSVAFFVTAILFCFYAFTYRTGDAAALLLPAFLLAAMSVDPWLMQIESKVVWLIPLAISLLTDLTPDDSSAVSERQATQKMLKEVPYRAFVLSPGDASIAAPLSLTNLGSRSCVVAGSEFNGSVALAAQSSVATGARNELGWLSFF